MIDSGLKLYMHGDSQFSDSPCSDSAECKCHQTIHTAINACTMTFTVVSICLTNADIIVHRQYMGC